jgi:4-diphosphocytidyl-2-C-methyl-D-erythritol kinase
VVVFKPGFGISTPWAFTRLAADAPSSYEPTVIAESRLAAWIADMTAPAEELLFNSMEGVAFGKFMALPALVAQLRSEFGLVPRMSGSGSACFAFLSEAAPFEAVAVVIRKAWGPAAFVTEARIT